MSPNDQEAPFGGAYFGVPAMVLGASGFIGRWVARSLCRSGAAVHAIVRSQATAAAVLAQYGIDGDVIEADLTQAGLLESIIGAVRPAIVFNLAGYGVDRAERDGERFDALNARLLLALCEGVRRISPGVWPGQRIVHAGSALEYGVAAGRLHETLLPQPTTVYGRTKLAGTRHLIACGAEHGLRAVTGRLFTVYGPGEHASRLVPALLEGAASGRPVELSRGDQQRDFTYVEDAAEGLLRLGTSDAAPGEVVNLATGRLTSVRRFAEEAASVLGLPATALKFGSVPGQIEEMFHDKVVIERLQALTHWAPPTGIADGIRRTRDFYHAHGHCAA